VFFLSSRDYWYDEPCDDPPYYLVIHARDYWDNDSDDDPQYSLLTHDLSTSSGTSIFFSGSVQGVHHLITLLTSSLMLKYSMQVEKAVMKASGVRINLMVSVSASDPIVQSKRAITMESLILTIVEFFMAGPPISWGVLFLQHCQLRLFIPPFPDFRDYWDWLFSPGFLLGERLKIKHQWEDREYHPKKYEEASRLQLPSSPVQKKGTKSEVHCEDADRKDVGYYLVQYLHEFLLLSGVGLVSCLETAGGHFSNMFALVTNDAQGNRDCQEGKAHEHDPV